MSAADRWNTKSGCCRHFAKASKKRAIRAGRNVAVQYRFSDGDDSRLPAIAAEFVRRQVAVIVAIGGLPAVAVKGATSTIPIVFSSGADPVGQGLVESLSRPGGNATGVAVFSNELGPKRLELLRELAPKAGLIAFVANLHEPHSGRAGQGHPNGSGGAGTENPGGECLHTGRGRTGFRNHRAGKGWRCIV